MDRRIDLACYGTAGDVLPALALATRLFGSGVRVRCLTTPQFRRAVEQRGLPWLALPSPDPSRVEAVMDLVLSERDPGRRTEFYLSHLVTPEVPGILRSLLGSANERDMLVVNGMLNFVASDVRFEGEALGVWYCAPFVSATDKPAAGRELFQLGAFSPTLLRADERPERLGPCASATGFWMDDAIAEPTPELAEFCAGGGPRFYFGLGSVSRGLTGDEFPAFLAAVESFQGRVVAQGRWPWRDRPQPTWVFCADFLPLGWIFTHVAAAVLHGGAGSVALALDAACPLVLMPQIGDQIGWARRLVEDGLAVGSLAPRSDAASWNEMLADALTPEHRLLTNLAQGRGRFRAEDGVGKAARIILEAGMPRRSAKSPRRTDAHTPPAAGRREGSDGRDAARR